jgi:hypothetical protein
MADEILPWGSKQGKTCDCTICKYSRKVEGVIERRDPDELIAVVKELMDASYNMGHDLDYANCVLDGSWPSAVEQLERALERAKNHPNRKLEAAEAKF